MDGFCTGQHKIQHRRKHPEGNRLLSKGCIPDLKGRVPGEHWLALLCSVMALLCPAVCLSQVAALQLLPR